MYYVCTNVLRMRLSTYILSISTHTRSGSAGGSTAIYSPYLENDSLVRPPPHKRQQNNALVNSFFKLLFSTETDELYYCILINHIVFLSVM
jgi:hypothetical protein